MGRRKSERRIIHPLHGNIKKDKGKMIKQEQATLNEMTVNNIENIWKRIKRVATNTAKEVLGETMERKY